MYKIWVWAFAVVLVTMGASRISGDCVVDIDSL